jgi:hypothetical protein
MKKIFMLLSFNWNFFSYLLGTFVQNILRMMMRITNPCLYSSDIEGFHPTRPDDEQIKRKCDKKISFRSKA